MSNRQPAVQGPNLGSTADEPNEGLPVGTFVLSCALCGAIGLVALAAVAQFLVQVWHPLV